MTLFEHLAELRYRLVICVIAIVTGAIVSLIFRGQLFNLLTRPYHEGIAMVKADRPELVNQLVLPGISSPFTITLAIAGVAGLILASPIWIYQVWAFIVPGLLAKEKKWTVVILGTAVPLFLIGIGMCYAILPRAVAILIGFTPEGQELTNLQSLSEFLGFMLRLLVVFGLAFEVPLFIVMLNIVGVLPAKMISKYRSYIIFAMFVFAAVATPTPDASVMLMLALPMTALVILSEVIAYALDRRKRKRSGDGEFGHSVDDDLALQQLEAEGSGDDDKK